jgi:aconitase A
MINSFRARSTLNAGERSYEIWSLAALPQDKLARLPYSLKILLENLLRFEDGVSVTRADVEALLEWDPQATPSHASFCRTSPACRVWWTWRPCAMPSCAWAVAPNRSTR